MTTQNRRRWTAKEKLQIIEEARQTEHTVSEVCRRHGVAVGQFYTWEKRALPIAWIVVRGNKGHFPEETHLRLVEQVHDLVPEGCDVIFLGDGEFDGTTLQATVTAYGWEYVCRTAKNAHIGQEDYQFPLHKVEVQPGECLGLYDVFFTHQAYGPVLVIAWWKAEYKEPIYLVTKMSLLEEACWRGPFFQKPALCLGNFGKRTPSLTTCPRAFWHIGAQSRP